MRILILPALLATGVFAQTPPSKAVEQAPATETAPAPKDAEPAAAQTADPARRFFFVAPGQRAPQRFWGLAFQNPNGKPGPLPDHLVIAGVPNARGPMELTPGRACAIPLLDVSPKDGTSMDPKIVIEGTAKLDNVDHMPAIQLPAPPCAGVKR